MHCPPANEFRSWEQLSTQPEWGLWSCQNVHWLFSSLRLHSNLESLAPQSTSEDAWPRGLSIFGTSVGPASHAAPSVLAETSNSSTCLASQTPPYQGEPGQHCSSGPLVGPSVDGTGRAPGHGLQKEGGLDRRCQLRLGGGCCATAKWPSAPGRRKKLPSHQLPRNTGSMVGPSYLSTRPEGTSHLSPFGQYDGGDLHK